MLCAAGELGITSLPEIPGFVCMNQPLLMDSNCESAINRLSSGSTTGSHPIGANLTNAGYSLPHNLVFAASITVNHAVPPPLTPNERKLKIVGVLKFVGLHFVMQGPTGNFMDQADGQDFNTFDD